MNLNIHNLRMEASPLIFFGYMSITLIQRFLIHFNKSVGVFSCFGVNSSDSVGFRDVAQDMPLALDEEDVQQAGDSLRKNVIKMMVLL